MQNPLVNAPNGAICCKLWPNPFWGWGAKIWATRCPFGAFRVPFWHHFGTFLGPFFDRLWVPNGAMWRPPRRVFLNRDLFAVSSRKASTMVQTYLGPCPFKESPMEDERVGYLLKSRMGPLLISGSESTGLSLSKASFMKDERVGLLPKPGMGLMRIQRCEYPGPYLFKASPMEESESAIF